MRYPIIAIALVILAPAARAVDRMVPSSYPTIQAAVAAAQPGDRVLIASGVYVETVTIGSKKELTIEGAGKTVLLGDGANDGMILDHVSNCALIGLTFRNHGRALLMEESGGVAVRGCMFEDFVTNGFYAVSCQAVRVTKCRFESSPVGTGVRTTDVRQLVVDDCRFEKLKMGTWLEGSDLASVVEGNDFLGVPHAIWCYGSAVMICDNDAPKGRFTLSGNALTLLRNDGGRIQLTGIGCTVVDNRVVAEDGIGIEVTGSSNQIAMNRVVAASIGYASWGDNSFAFNNAKACGVGFAAAGVLIGNSTKKCSLAEFDDSSAETLLDNSFGSAGPSGDTLKVPKQFPSIQFAVDAAQPGDKIVVSAGTYPEAVNVTGKSDLSIVGKGKVILHGGGVGVGMRVSQSARIHLKGITFRQHDRGLLIEQSDGTIVEKCRFEEFEDYGLDFEKVTGALATGCTFQDSAAGVAVLGQQSLGLVIDDCRTTQVGYGINFNYDVTASMVRGCKIESAATGLSTHGTANLLMENDADGAQVYCSGEAAVVLGNRARELTALAGARHFILGNQFVGSDDVALQISSDVTISAHNVLSKAQLFGMSVQTSPGCLFAFNKIVKCPTGLIVSSDQVAFVGNVAKKSGLADVGQVFGSQVYFIENSFDTP